VQRPSDSCSALEFKSKKSSFASRQTGICCHE
jgi:hypothetical protein